MPKLKDSGDKKGKPNLSKEIWKAVSTVTDLYELLKETKNNAPNSESEKRFREVESAQLHLFKAWYTLKPEYVVPAERSESFDHFIAKNEIVKDLKKLVPTLEIIHQFKGFSGCRPDVLVKTNEEYIILEAETDSGECMRKPKTQICS